MTNTGGRPSPLDVLGGGLLLVIGVIIGATGGQLLLAVFLIAVGVALLVWGVVRRRRASRSPQTPTT